ncbi:MAG: transglycosylase SLT domain-containing protein [Ignavibacteriaceae bacterium]|nr:transglycosylase SLT domain-containing protein [Ignavibacteriaceae bacterium]
MNVLKLKKAKGISFQTNNYSRKVIKSLNENKYDDLFHKYGEEFGIDWLFLKSQIKCESNFNPKAVNKARDAKGLSQFTEKMWNDLKRFMPGRLNRRKVFRPFDPAFSIMAQCLYLEYAFKRIDDLLIDKNYLTDWALAVYKLGIIKVLGGRNQSGKYVKGIIEDLVNKPIEDAWLEFGMKVFEYIADVEEAREAYKRE